MKRIIIFSILSVCFINTMRCQTQINFSEAHLYSKASVTDRNPQIPKNLGDVFAGEIAGKLAMEVGSCLTVLGSVAAIVLTPPPIQTVGFLTLTGGAAGMAGTMGANASAYNYGIESWAPYIEYHASTQNKPTSQKATFNVDLIKSPKDNGSRYVAIDAAIRLAGANESDETESTIRRSKFMDLYTFKLLPKNPELVILEESFPEAENRVATYSSTFSIDVSGGTEINNNLDPTASAGVSVGYSSTSSVSSKDFEIRSEDPGPEGVMWFLNMANVYDIDKKNSIYRSPTDLVVSNASTKWLKNPAPLAMGSNKLKVLGLFKIKDVNETRPIEFEYEGVQQLMHVEVLGRWGLPGAKLSGISVAVPSYNVIKGIITVTPNPSNPSKATITINRYLNKRMTYQQYMDYTNIPLVPKDNPVLLSGCYSIRQNIDANNNYVTHGGGPGVVNYNANRNDANTWEKFSLVYTGKAKDGNNVDTYGIYSQDARFMQAQPTGAVLKSTNLGNWEKWEIVPIPGQVNKYRVKSVAHKRWLSGNRNLSGHLGTSGNSSDWEVWSFDPQITGCAQSPIKPLPPKPIQPTSDIAMSDVGESFTVSDYYNPVASSGVNTTTSLDDRSTTFSNQSNTVIPCNFCQSLNEVTVEAWIKNTNVGNDIQAIVSASGPQFVHLQMSGDNNVSNTVYMDNGQSMMLPVIPKVSAGWHHVALSVKSGNTRVFLDGQQIGNTNTTTYNSLTPLSEFYIGKGWSGQRAFNGEMANVKVWKKALTPSEINTSMNEFNHGPNPDMVYHSPTCRPIQIVNSNDCIAVPNNATSGHKSITVEGWINNKPGGEYIQAIVSSSTGDFIHFQTSANSAVQNMVYTNTGAVSLPVIPKLTQGWHHVALVAESGNSRIYVDGAMIGNANTKTFSNILSSQSTNIGKGWAGARVFNGNIADVRIWKDRALTQQQIESYRHTPPPATAQGLVYHSK